MGCTFVALAEQPSHAVWSRDGDILVVGDVVGRLHFIMVGTTDGSLFHKLPYLVLLSRSSVVRRYAGLVTAPRKVSAVEFSFLDSHH